MKVSGPDFYRGRLLKSGMTENTVCGQILFIAEKLADVYPGQPTMLLFFFLFPFSFPSQPFPAFFVSFSGIINS
jgi:hypothetical protein